jgi:hypothetical protein
MPIKAIVRRIGVSRNAVHRALATGRPPKYERPSRGSLVDAVEPEIRELLSQSTTSSSGHWPITTPPSASTTTRRWPDAG